MMPRLFNGIQQWVSDNGKGINSPQTAQARPKEAPVVTRHSLTPARARGTPTARDQANQMIAGGEKSIPAPSEAEPCGTAKEV